MGIAQTGARVLVLRDGLLLGADGYEGEPARVVIWHADPSRLRRAIDEASDALGISPVSGVVCSDPKK
jgi:hypothetical protein